MDRRFRDGLERAKSIIAGHGWVVQMVASSPPLAYTVGLSRTFGHPEVFLVGFGPETSYRLLNDVGELIRAGADFAEPSLCDKVARGFDVAFRPASRQSAERNSGIGQQLVGSFDAVQLFLPDPAGLFPWDRECDPGYAELQTRLLTVEGEVPVQRRGPTLN